ncbi:MAG: hypothetical protein LBI31_02725 [Zoogloeaceae bacterium]|jgi:hypothetical protein|nr:hypothetical protein [Zoogloeaceae bacterium]
MPDKSPLVLGLTFAEQASGIKSPSAGHTSMEGNKTGASVFTARSAKLIPLYGGVARSAGVVRAACHAGAASCLIYYGNCCNA